MPSVSSLSASMRQLRASDDHPFKTAKIRFLRDSITQADIRDLVVIHIPLAFKHQFVKAISSLVSAEYGNKSTPSIASRYPHSFVSYSVTPFESSIICPRYLAQQIIIPKAKEQSVEQKIDISKDNYLAIAVESMGVESCERIADLTAPLASKGVSIFYVSSTDKDYIIAPHNARSEIIECFEARYLIHNPSSGVFTFEVPEPTSQEKSVNFDDDDDYISPHGTSPIPIPKAGQPYQKPLPRHSLRQGANDNSDEISILSTLKARTMKLLREQDIHPFVNNDMVVQQFSAPERPSREESQALFTALEHCIRTTASPREPERFFSICLASTSPLSLWLETSLLPAFATSSGSILTPSRGRFVPLILDLRRLPMMTLTGMVCGIVATLLDARVGGATKTVAFLSSARSATVCVEEGELGPAQSALVEAMTKR